MVTRMRRLIVVAIIGAGLMALAYARPTKGNAQDDAATFAVDAPAVMLTGLRYDFTLRLPPDPSRPSEVDVTIVDGESGRPVAAGARRVATVDAEGEALGELLVADVGPFDGGDHDLVVQIEGLGEGARGGAYRTPHAVRVLPALLSLVPPLLAIILAVAFRQVLLALFAGVLSGAFFLSGYDPLAALLRTIDLYAVDAVKDPGHAAILVFSFLLGGMLGLVSRSGGGIGMANLVTRQATSSTRGQLSAWLLGLLIFFDDYANSLLVGTTMRPITDRLRISREKLAFIVDATAAPVASLAIISSWIGVEVGYIADQYAALGLEGDPYLLFLESIPYRFYPLLMLVFGFAMIWMKRDFGPMLKAERRARQHGELMAKGAKPATDFDDKAFDAGDAKPRWINAVAPILVVVTTALTGMYLDGRATLLEDRATTSAELADAETALIEARATGSEATAASLSTLEDRVANAERLLAGGQADSIRNVFGKADSVRALGWASLFGCVVAFLLVLLQRTMTLTEAFDAWFGGARAMLLATMILVLAWSIGAVCREMQTARFVISAIGPWLSVGLLPAVVFIVAALVSFATGTSWGTMAILFPLVVPMAHALGPADHALMVGAISSILGGSVFGDHCSPISDTTIMSSMASSCDHVDHVRTQLPYALLVGLVSVVFGDIATGMGLYPAWAGLLIGGAVVVGFLRIVGKPLPDHRLS